MMNGDLNLSYTMADDGYETEMTRMGVAYNVFEKPICTWSHDLVMKVKPL